MNKSLVGGFNPFEKYWSKWESSPNRGEHKNYLKPPPRSGSWVPQMKSTNDISSETCSLKKSPCEVQLPKISRLEKRDIKTNKLPHQFVTLQIVCCCCFFLVITFSPFSSFFGLLPPFFSTQLPPRFFQKTPGS